MIRAHQAIRADLQIDSRESGHLSGIDKRVVSKRVALADVPPERKPERGYIRMFPGTKTGTRVRLHAPPPERKPERGYVRQNHFYETALLSPSESKRSSLVRSWISGFSASCGQ